jgi:hypothetical protein
MVFDGTNVASGNLATLGVKEESAWANFTASPIWMGIVKNFTHKQVPSIVPLGGIRDSRRAVDMKMLGYHYEGVIEGELQNCMPLYMALGLISTTPGTPNTHAINIARGETGGALNYLPSFSVHAQHLNWDGTSADELVGLKGLTVGSATFRFPLNEVATFSLNYIAQEKQVASVTAPTESSLAQYTSYNTDLLVDNDSSTYSSGDDVDGLDSLEWTIDNGLKFYHEFNSALIRQPFMGSVREGITARINRKYVDTDLTALADGTPFSWQLQCIRTASTDYIYITGEYCYISSLERTMNIDNAIENTPVEVKMAKVSVAAKDAISSYE